MLSLESPRWAELNHAYGAASDIPPLLAQLDTYPNSDADYRSEPWFSLWSALAHQGDVYPASFAAVPHVVRLIASAPLKAGTDFFGFPAWVEMCRRRKNVQVPDDLAPAYFAALEQLPSLVGEAAGREWDAEFLQCALSAIAAVKGDVDVADAILDMSPEMARKFMDWQFDR